MQDSLNEMLNPVFWEKKKKKYHQFVVYWISPQTISESVEK